MKDSSIKTDRLLILAEHLRKRKQFEGANRSASLPTLRIHENGCIIRHFDFPFYECAHIFSEWTFTSDGLPSLREVSQSTIADSAMDYFNLDNSLFQHLFSPLAQDYEKYGGRILQRNASKRDIAFNIRCFLETRENKITRIAA